MAQVKIINNTGQKLEILVQDQKTKCLNGSALQGRSAKIIDSSEVSTQIKNLANRKLITILELG